MKKVPAIVALAAVLAVGYLLFGSYRTSPLRGKLKAATVTMKYFSTTTTNAQGLNIVEKTIEIQSPTEVAAIQSSLTRIRNHFVVNSMEGLPKYRMQVEYADGSTQQFVFTRTEWAGGGLTPTSLVEILTRNGL